VNDAGLEVLWKHVTNHWDDEAAHRAFLEHCRVNDRLVEAAVRYRGMKGDHARGPLAEKKLAAIAALALTRLETERSPSPAKRGSGFAYLLIALFVAGTAGLLAYLDASR
jgi:hypothetical protein